MFLAEIVAIRVNSDLLDDKGRLLLHKAKLIGYSHGEYLGLGRQLGKFGFSVAHFRKKSLCITYYANFSPLKMIDSKKFGFLVTKCYLW